MKTDFKKEAIKAVNGFDEVKSVVCIISDGEQAGILVGAENDTVLKNTLVNAMVKQPEIKSLFQGAIVAATLLDGEGE